MPDPAAKRLDEISANLAEVLRHADALLDEWARFGAGVRAQVEREAEQVAGAVADATGAAIERAASAQLASLRAEVAQLEQRVRAASRIVAEQRAHDRRLLGGIAAGVAVAIALLVVLVALVARGPGSAQAPVAPAPEPIRVEPASTPPPDARIDAPAPAEAPPPADAATAPRPSRRR
jgi:hypothetical protein